MYLEQVNIIAAQVFKISYFNKIKRQSPLIIILPAAFLFLFLPQITGIGVPGAGTSLMPFFILSLPVGGIIIGFLHDRIEKYKKSRPPKYIDPYSKKAIKMRDRQLREEEYEMQKYRDDNTIQLRKKQLEEEDLKKKQKNKFDE